MCGVGRAHTPRYYSSWVYILSSSRRYASSHTTSINSSCVSGASEGTTVQPLQGQQLSRWAEGGAKARAPRVPLDVVFFPHAGVCSDGGSVYLYLYCGCLTNLNVAWASKRCAAPALPGTVSVCGHSRGTSSVAGSCAQTKVPATTASRYFQNNTAFHGATTSIPLPALPEGLRPRPRQAGVRGSPRRSGQRC